MSFVPRLPHMARLRFMEVAKSGRLPGPYRTGRDQSSIRAGLPEGSTILLLGHMVRVTRPRPQRRQQQEAHLESRGHHIPKPTPPTTRCLWLQIHDRPTHLHTRHDQIKQGAHVRCPPLASCKSYRQAQFSISNFQLSSR